MPMKAYRSIKMKKWFLYSFRLLVPLLFLGLPDGLAKDDVPTIYIRDIKGDPILHAYVSLDEKEVLVVGADGSLELPPDMDQSSTLTIVAMGYDQKVITFKDVLENPSIVLNERVGNLDEVVIGATRTNRSVEDLPMPVTVIGNDKIQKTGALRLSEVLRE